MSDLLSLGNVWNILLSFLSIVECGKRWIEYNKNHIFVYVWP